MFAAEALALAALVAAAPPARDTLTQTFSATAAGEAILAVRAGCSPCDWGVEGREAAALRISRAGRYSQHLVLARGEAPSEYRITLGGVAKGVHTLAIARDPALSANHAGAAEIAAAAVDVVTAGADAFVAQSMAPILFARANTVGKFTDLPILMWYEVAPTSRGRRFRYSVIFTNEDGGTATDRLMATWGRTTDIEYVYGVELNDRDEIIGERIQGAGHDLPAFAGRHEGKHPLLWVEIGRASCRERV